MVKETWDYEINFPLIPIKISEIPIIYKGNKLASEAFGAFAWVLLSSVTHLINYFLFTTFLFNVILILKIEINHDFIWLLSLSILVMVAILNGKGLKPAEE